MITNETGIHLCTLKPDAWQKIMDGRKKVESRMTINRQPPFKNIKPGDVVYCKHNNLIYGMFIAGTVNCYENLDAAGIDRLIAIYRDSVCASREWWMSKAKSNYFTFIEVAGWHEISPVRLKDKNLSRSSWKLNFDISEYEFRS